MLDTVPAAAFSGEPPRARPALASAPALSLAGDPGAGPEALPILLSLAEYYDDDSPAHSQRVGRTAGRIAAALGCHEDSVSRIEAAAKLHDVGKIGISRRVLLKPEALTPFERENMMRHVEIGPRLLAGASSPEMRLAAEIARTHHERWDGAGYILGLKEQEIPLAGRITAVADVFDVLTHVRPYKPAWELDRALEELRLKAGTQFDPRVVAAFLTLDAADLLELPGDSLPDA